MTFKRNNEPATKIIGQLERDLEVLNPSLAEQVNQNCPLRFVCGQMSRQPNGHCGRVYTQ